MFPQIANSLVNPKESAREDRRVIAGETATTAAPTNDPEGSVTKGHRVRHHRYLHVGAQAVGGTSFELTVWGKSDFMNRWFVIDWFGTSGAETITAGDTNQYQPLEIDGIDEVYFQISAITGSTANVWAAGNSTG